MRTALLLFLFFLFHPYLSRGQFCNGSLGDPVVNITFGQHHYDLAYNETDFLVANGCPAKGQYVLASLIFGCGDNRSWLTVAGDHTLDPGGNYMLINAESWDGVTTPAVIHKDTATGLCSNVTYVYSAWVTNVLRQFSCGGHAVPASIFLKVTTLSGTVIATFNSGDIPISDEKDWKQYGVAFNLPPGESTAIVSAITYRKYGCGQAFAIDDITLKPCGPQVMATVNGATDPLNVCEDYTKDFVFEGTVATGFVNPSYQWQSSLDSGRTWTDIPTAVSTSFTVSQKKLGVVWYRMAAAEGDNIKSLHCRVLSNILYTNVLPLKQHQPPEDVLGCLNKDLHLPKSDPYAISSIWTGPGGYSSSALSPVIPNITNAATGLYQVKQTFFGGCSDLDTFYVKVYPSTTISVAPEYNVCEGQQVRLAATGDGTFNWQPATGLSDPNIPDPMASPHDSTFYQVMVTNAYGCKDSAFVKINVFRNPVVNAGVNHTIVKGDTVTLNGSVSGTKVNYYWSPPSYLDNDKAMAPLAAPPSDIQYTLVAQSMVGCGTVTSDVYVKVYNEVYIPNVFTPNNDGKNDVFRIVAADGYQLMKFAIYNRWGREVFDAGDFSKGWDGTYNGLPQPADTYIYFLKMRSSSGNIIVKKGAVTLLR